MEKIELIAKIKKARENFELECKNIKKLYAVENNPVKVGDIIVDKYSTRLKVEKWLIYCGTEINSVPYLVYKGIRVTDSGSKSKIQDYNEVRQIYIKEINNKPYNYFLKNE